MGSLSTFASWRTERIAKLRASATKENVLQRWLEGYDLPAINSYAEGNAWLLEAAREVPSLADELAPVAATLVRLYSSGKVESKKPERLGYNLFYLCAGLRKPEVLWNPLLHFLEIRTRGSGGTPHDLGQYRGVPIRMAFKAALAENQGDRRLEGVWRLMLGEPQNEYVCAKLPSHFGEIMDFLDGSPTDGFEGILALPKRLEKSRDEVPDEVLIGWALARMADFLDKVQFREEQFSSLIEKVKLRFNTDSWNFLLLAGQCGWRKWALRMVGDPERLISIRYTHDKHVRYIEESDQSIVLIPEQYRHDIGETIPLIWQLVCDFRVSRFRNEDLQSQLQYGMPQAPDHQDDQSIDRVAALASKIEACLHV